MNDSRKTLYALIGGIVALTSLESLIFIILELCIDIIYVDGIIKFILGGIVGSVIAILLVCDMYRVFDRAFDCDSDTAESMVRKGSLLRMTVLFTILVLLIVFLKQYISIWMTFLSILNLKLAAYLVPICMKMLDKTKIFENDL